MRHILLISIASIIFSLTGCGVPPIQVDTIDNQLPTFSPASPPPVNVMMVHWTVLNNNVIQTLAKKNDPNTVYYALDSANFHNTIMNFADTLRYIEQQNANVQFFQSYNTSLTTPKK